MQFTIQDGSGEAEPSTYAICPEMGSAYYLYGGDDALVQVPLDAEGKPTFETPAEVEEPEDRFFGGGDVDWERSFDTDAAREEVSRISEALKGAGVPKIAA